MSVRAGKELPNYNYVMGKLQVEYTSLFVKQLASIKALLFSSDRNVCHVS